MAYGLTTTVSQVGFAAGVVLVLPVGDLVDRRRLLVGLLLADAVGLLLVASSVSYVMLLVAFGVVGVCNVAAQVIVPAAAAMAEPARRGRVVGTVISGLLIGMLIARTVSGALGEWIGWRVTFVLAAALTVLVAVAARRVLPPQATVAAPSVAAYARTLRSLGTLLRTHRTLTVRAVYGGLGFAAFTVFWTTAAFLLGGAPYHYNPATIGLFGLLGAAGALAASLAGRIRRPHHPVPTIVAVLVIAAGFTALSQGAHALAAVVVGTLVLGIGVQGLHVLNQRNLYDLPGAARNRANSVYMTFYFVGGALGSAAATLAWDDAGWTGVWLTGLVIAALAALVWLVTTVAGRTRSTATEEREN
ncbi:MFS transporter [Pseudonocardia xinjiangensis]|uniref:MFS transporter n=1 Tax=Pseudonocardia xinjiangensis TaxID=75289 RepID=UPI003D8EFC95